MEGGWGDRHGKSEIPAKYRRNVRRNAEQNPAVDWWHMDVFDVLTAISKRKIEFMNSGMNENEALIKAEFDVSKNYHIPLLDIRKVGR